MAYREVTMLEIKEVLRLWQAGVGKKRIAAQLGLDPKTVRRYVEVAITVGVDVGDELTDERVEAVVAAVRALPPRARGDAWETCVAEHDFVRGHLDRGVRLTKVWRLLQRRGVHVPYSTLYRYAKAELGFGRKRATVLVADGEPGDELQVDTGWVLTLLPDGSGRRRRKRAFIFTPNVSRYRFVYPVDDETTASAIEACEAAWAFYGGVFKTLVPDNMRAIVNVADGLGATINAAFLEYAQARGFHVDATRVRKATDKGRVERAVRDVRDDCFGGEELADLEVARTRARTWCADEYGMRRHSTTGRMPKEHFEAAEAPALLPAPTRPYDVPLWCDPKVHRDHHAQVAKALYSLPTKLIGKRLRARADSGLVRFYLRGVLVKTHPRKPPGGRSTDPNDFPSERRAYAMRDVNWLRSQAGDHGEAIGGLAGRLLAGPLPWTRMRQVHSLLSLVRRFGAARVEDACRRALAADMHSVRRLRRMVELAVAAEPPAGRPATPPAARYLRPAHQYALPGLGPEKRDEET